MKLVRDKIPAMMEAGGRKPIIHFAEKEEFEKFLIEKLGEEIIEFKKDRTVEELADLIEVAYSLANLMGITPKELEGIRIKKIGKKGGFFKRTILENPSL